MARVFGGKLLRLGLVACALGLFPRAAHAEEQLPVLNQDAAPQPPTSETDKPSDASSDADANAPPKPCPTCRHALGAQALWVTGKFIPEVSGRFDFHRWFWVDAELGLVFLLDPPPGEDRVVLGSPLAAHLVFVPYRSRIVELGLGAGADLHLLYGVGKGIVEVALALKAIGHVWVTPRLGLFGSARVYPVATEGLGLGEKRDGSRGLPVLFATGVEWGFP
ncbi:MAG TPA: hypothetical protein VNN72_02905 [Polyangiaceae bacterium]|nr:hypothetical protein [Polyangiaceae bacterium]